jgi:hypothetical protein
MSKTDLIASIEDEVSRVLTAKIVDSIDAQTQIKEERIQLAEEKCRALHKQRINLINDAIDIIKAQIEEFKDHPAALEYYNKVRESDAQINAVQSLSLAELRKYYPDVVAAGSFTSRTNLVDVSDVDIYVFQELSESPPNMEFELLAGPYEQHDKYDSFTQMIHGVNVEVKFRPDRDILALHEWLDTQMTDEQRRAITYIKHRAAGTESYQHTKNTIFNWALQQMGRPPAF